jgi:hypothetical protein
MVATIHWTLTGSSWSSIRDINSRTGSEESRLGGRDGEPMGSLVSPIPICSHFLGVKSVGSITIYNERQLAGKNRRRPIHWMLTGSSLTSMREI